jgi:hypothetical protein
VVLVRDSHLSSSGCAAAGSVYVTALYGCGTWRRLTGGIAPVTLTVFENKQRPVSLMCSEVDEMGGMCSRQGPHEVCLQNLMEILCVI